MFEILDKRNYNSKTFDNENGSESLMVSTGQLHYFDKLDSKRFREIDWTLHFDDIKRGWYFNYHSFRPFIPEYSDGWVEFRDLFDDKDQITSFRGVCSRVKGRLVQSKDIGLEKETDWNCVIYDDAFGEGFDYIIYFKRRTLKKVVRIREGFNPHIDINFDYAR